MIRPPAARAATLATATLVVAALAGCTAPAATWAVLDLPEGFTAARVLVVGDDLVIGGSVDDAPALLRWEPEAASPVDVPVEPGSFYGALALWTTIVADGERMFALGGRTGGGHGNPRWSTWVGDRDGLVEDPEQGREVFGGWRGGGLAGLAVVDGEPFIVGGRTGEHPGFDIAVWSHVGDDWLEHPSTGTALAATEDALPFPTSVTSAGSDLVITGYRQVLGGGTVENRAAVWIGTPTGPYERLDLPAGSTVASAHAATCDPDRCVVVGDDDGMLTVWVVADGEVETLTVPATLLDADVPAPVLRGDEIVLVVPSEGATTILRSAGDSWASTGLPGTAVDATGWRADVVVVDSDGAVRRVMASLGS